jgi:hypothetical protein
MTHIEFKHAHLFCGLGGGAAGFNDARVEPIGPRRSPASINGALCSFLRLFLSRILALKPHRGVAAQSFPKRRYFNRPTRICRTLGRKHHKVLDAVVRVHVHLLKLEPKV